MVDIRNCDEHGFFKDELCPECGNSGDLILKHDKWKGLSNFATWALRHRPDEAGLDIDNHGWADAREVVEAAKEDRPWVTLEDLAAVVSTDGKGRFEVEGNKIRAVYGHSIDVEINVASTEVPETLYHGTPKENVSDIRSEGLVPMGRKEVHLSDSRNRATDVGERHSDEVVILEIEAEGLEEEGYQIEKRGTETYTVQEVPPEYITF